MKEIPLTRGLVALIDDEDYEELSQFSWYATGRGYAWRVLPKVPGKKWYSRMGMHRQIMGLDPSDVRVVDHIDRNPLNNQRSNIRICTEAENYLNRKVLVTNTSGFKGVSWHKQYKKWRAQIQVNCKKTVIGFYDSPEDAHAAYCVAAKKMHGEFANTEIKAVAELAGEHVAYVKRKNKTGFKGVKFDPECRKWTSKIMRNGKMRYLGYFNTPEAAHEAYCRAAAEPHTMGQRRNAGKIETLPEMA